MARPAPWSIELEPLAINARLVFYSASMAPRWRGTSAWFRAAASYLLIDPSYAVGSAGYDRHPGRRGHLHYLGAALVLWVAWQAAITTGYLAGAGLPLHAGPLLGIVAGIGAACLAEGRRP